MLEAEGDVRLPTPPATPPPSCCWSLGEVRELSVPVEAPEEVMEQLEEVSGLKTADADDVEAAEAAVVFIVEDMDDTVPEAVVKTRGGFWGIGST